MNDIKLCISKDQYLKHTLERFRIEKTNTINKIIKVNNNFLSKNQNVFLYLIIFYDNAKINIDFYGIFNQEICNDKLLNNIKNENIYGKEGIITNNIGVNNLQNKDFIILFKKIKII